MPFKISADRRHHIPRQRHKVTNWVEYDAGLRARGSLTIWFPAETIEAWRAEPRTGRGGGGQHRPAALRPRSVADREARHQAASVVESAASRHRRRHRPHRRLGVDRQGCR